MLRRRRSHVWPERAILGGRERVSGEIGVVGKLGAVWRSWERSKVFGQVWAAIVLDGSSCHGGEHRKPLLVVSAPLSISTISGVVTS